jgi:hypothetical protein
LRQAGSIMFLEPFTTIAAWRRLRRLGDPEPAQRALLKRILASCAGSPVSDLLGLRGDETFEEFLGLEPRDYSAFAPLVERARDGDLRTFGRSPVIALGMTSGSTGAPKLVPYNAESRDLFRRFLRVVRLLQVCRGRTFLPHRTKWLLVAAPGRVRDEGVLPAGFISGLMYLEARAQRGASVLPSPEVAALDDWGERVRRSAAEALGEPVGTLFGVPAYLDAFLREAAEQSRGRPLGEVWPRLEEVYYSGTDAQAHWAGIEARLGRAVAWRGLYMATEGVFGAELDDDAAGLLRLLPDLAVMTFLDGGRLRPMWDLERGCRYELVVTTVSGLIQYRLGDLIEVVEASPLRVRLAGRVGDELNLATEKLSCRQAEAAVAEAGPAAGLDAARFVVLPDATGPRRHLWVAEGAPDGADGAAAIAIDRALARLNPSYAALRACDAVLAPPRVVVVPRGTFDAYVRAGVARCGQFKFRHLFPSREALLRAEGMDAVAPYLEGESLDGRPRP